MKWGALVGKAGRENSQAIEAVMTATAVSGNAAGDLDAVVIPSSKESILI